VKNLIVPRSEFFCFSIFDQGTFLVSIITDKARTKGEEDRRCRCYERQRSKARGDGSLSHTRWSRGRSCPWEMEGVFFGDFQVREGEVCFFFFFQPLPLAALAFSILR